MRKILADTVIKIATQNERIIFLTGDLGFMALEQVRDVLKERFINAGVAEQNMITIAAALAYEGFIPLVYSISPFVTLRPYEQIRNDVCLHNLPVKIIANGGGYGYGIMGGTHHNIEDIGSMRILPNMKVFVPFTEQDVKDCLYTMLTNPSPNYLRLNLASTQKNISAFEEWRNIFIPPLPNNSKAVVIATGTVAENLFKLPINILNHLDIWLVSCFPIKEIPNPLLTKIKQIKNVITLEEHQGQCGLNETLANLLLQQLNIPIHYNPLFANGYPSGKYGSQTWHQEENNLAGKNLENKIIQFINKKNAYT